MISTLEGLLVALLALIPGAVAVVVFRRLNGGKIDRTTSAADTFSDRVVAYAIFSILFAPLTIVVAATAWDYWFEVRGPDRAVSRLHRDDWEWFELLRSVLGLSLIYLAVPALGGALLAGVVRLWDKIRKPKTTYTTAWDALFAPLTAPGRAGSAVLLRWRVAGERPMWQAGAFGQNSRVSLVAQGGEATCERGVVVNPYTGRIEFNNAGHPKRTGGPITLRRDQIDALEQIA